MTGLVAITGIGVVSPLGRDLARFTSRLREGRSAAARLTLFDPAALPTQIGAEVPADDVPPTVRDRKIAFALLAARDAVADAGGAAALGQAYGAGTGSLSLGLGLELFSLPDMIAVLEGRASAGADPRSFLQTPSDLCVHAIGREHGLGMPPLTHISACAAATDALGTAFRLVRDGSRPWMLAGGTDSMLNPMGLAGFCKIEATTRRNHEPTRASRPFDRGRDGFLLGEGAGLMVLEPLDGARRRGARVYATIGGYGCSFDAYGISDPHPEGEGACLAMARALADAGLDPSRIDYVNAHGTSTPKNDPVESRAIERVLGPRARTIPVSSTKSMLGHLISAAGAVELAAAVLCARAGFVHPTINLEKPDPECPLDYVPGTARAAEVGWMLKDSFGFGGQNACLAVHVEGTPGA